MLADLVGSDKMSHEKAAPLKEKEPRSQADFDDGLMVTVLSRSRRQ